jgi:hypothetical protein
MKKLLLAILLTLTSCNIAISTELDDLRMKMRSTVDEVEGIKWIYDKATPNVIKGNMFYVYLGQKGRSLWPRLKASFTAEDWVFFENLIINYDGTRADIPINTHNIYRDAQAHIVYESIDLDASEYLELMKLISNSKKTIVRFEGSHRRHDFILSQKQKEALKRIVRLYELIYNSR